jgi:fructose-1,6-bisphosphatase
MLVFTFDNLKEFYLHFEAKQEKKKYGTDIIKSIVNNNKKKTFIKTILKSLTRRSINKDNVF